MVKEVLKDLVAINTIEDKENDKIIKYIGDFLGNQGFKVDIKTNLETEKSILVATYGEVSGADEHDNLAIGFMGHTDTVGVTGGWRTDPMVLTEKEGELYGLGACDMKGGIAAFMAAIAETDLSALKKGIGVYCTYDEEVLFAGIHDLNKAGVKLAQHMIIAEPTDLIPMTGSKGILEYRLTFKGVATHSSTPIEGKNSNKNAVKFLSKMLELEEDVLKKIPNDFFDVPYTTMNMGIINGGTAINKVPDHTSVYIDFRICDYHKEAPIIKEAMAKALEGVDVEIECLNDVESFHNETPLMEVYEQRTGNKEKPFFGLSEASFIDGDRLIIGPGPMTAHEANEHVNAKSLADAKDLFAYMIKMLCQ